MKRLISLFLLLLIPSAAPAGGSKADYERAAALGKRIAGKVFRDRIEPVWEPDGNAFSYRLDLPNGERQWIRVNALTGERGPRTSEAPPRPAQTGMEKIRPSANGGEDTEIVFVNRTDADLEVFWVDGGGGRKSYGAVKPGERKTQHTFAGHTWLLRDANGRTRAAFSAEAGGAEAVIDKETRAPREGRRRERREEREERGNAGPWRAFVRDFNVWAENKETQEEVQLSRDGSADDRYTGPFRWSPDGQAADLVQSHGHSRRAGSVLRPSRAGEF